MVLMYYSRIAAL